MSFRGTRVMLHRGLFVMLTTLLAAPLFAACPGTDREALGWLGRMAQSQNTVSYHGVLTLQRGEDLQVVQVSRRVEGTVATHRLTQLTGLGRHVQLEDHPLDCVHPGHKLLRVGADLTAGRCGIAEYYRFSVAGSATVAGRDAVEILVEPLDMYRFGYQMALDRETGLLLRTKILGHRHHALETLQFARLSYDAGGAAQADALPGDAHVHRAAHRVHGKLAHTLPVGRRWEVDWLPQGFTRTDVTSAESGRRTYTDGLAVFSVFLEHLDHGMRPGEGVVREGGTISYTRGLQLGRQPVLVTVIGEVPLNTARMVADAVQWVQ